jgi:hypothetical protein
LVTEPAKADEVFDPAEVGDAPVLEDPVLEVPVLEDPVLEDDGAELELALELQAAAPASRQAPTAATRHLEPVLIRRDIPVKRTIAPCRLSAVNSPVSGPSSARWGWRRRRTELIDQ